MVCGKCSNLTLKVVDDWPFWVCRKDNEEIINDPATHRCKFEDDTSEKSTDYR